MSLDFEETCQAELEWKCILKGADENLVVATSFPYHEAKKSSVQAVGNWYDKAVCMTASG